MEITREQVLRFRVHAQQLDREQTGESTTDADVLDIGVQDTGPDGSMWALDVRGFAPDPGDLFTAWTIRGAPHVYRRAQAAAVATAVAPLSEADAAKRIFDASKPLKEAGIPVLDALDRIAVEMRSVVTKPTVKGDLSGALNARLPEPFQRYCRPCDAIHLYEQPFRLSALRGGLELQPGTSPPVLQRIPGWRGMAADGRAVAGPGAGDPAAARPGDTEAGRGLSRRSRQGRARALARGRRAGHRRRRATRHPGRRREGALLRRGCVRSRPAARAVRPVPAGPRP